MTDPYNGPIDPQLEKANFSENYGESSTTQQLYERGIKKFRASGFTFAIDVDGQFCHHRVYVEKQPVPVKGINYPKSFRVKLPLSEPADIDLLQSLVMDEGDEETRKFWMPLVEADVTRRKPIFGHVVRLHQMAIESRKVNAGIPFDLGISYDCEVGNKTPIAWVPKAEWFDPQIREVEIKDVFTIFPQIELEMLKLIIGRLVVGRTNNLPVGHDRPLLHTARMAACIIGLDPGTGKSTLFNYLANAISRCGYRHSTFRNLGDRFNLGSVIKSALAYKDDLTSDSFRQFLRSEASKIIITNGEMRVEAKGIDAVDEFAHCVVILNSNSYDPRSVFDVDPGTADRVKLISTYSEAEIRALEPYGASEGSPNIKPFSHLPWLAEKLDCDVDALLLWICRQGADEFLRVIADTSDPTVNPLEARVRFLTNQLRYSMAKETTKQVFSLMVFAHTMRGGNCFSGELPQFRHVKWYEVMTDTMDFCHAVDFGEPRDVIMQLWLDRGLPTVHWGPGLKILDYESLSAAKIKWAESSIPELGNSISTLCRNVFEAVHLKNGFRLPGDLPWLIQEWEGLRSSLDMIKEDVELARVAVSKKLGPYAVNIITGARK